MELIFLNSNSKWFLLRNDFNSSLSGLITHFLSSFSREIVVGSRVIQCFSDIFSRKIIFRLRFINKRKIKGKKKRFYRIWRRRNSVD